MVIVIVISVMIVVITAVVIFVITVVTVVIFLLFFFSFNVTDVILVVIIAAIVIVVVVIVADFSIVKERSNAKCRGEWSSNQQSFDDLLSYDDNIGFFRIEGQLKGNFNCLIESVAKISNLQYIEVLQSYGNPIY